MTTIKYGLGYNKDGVLGVAGLLGNAAVKKLGAIFGSFNNYATGAKETVKFLANGATELSDLPNTPASTYVSLAGGNGKVFLWFEPSGGYVEVGAAPLLITEDGATWTSDITEIAGHSIVWNGYRANLAIITGIQWSVDKFYVTFKLVDSMGTSETVYYTTTQDFVTFTEKIVIPIASNAAPSAKYWGIGNKSSGRLFINEKTGELIASYYMGQDYYSADGITWTAKNLPMSLLDIVSTESGSFFVEQNNAFIAFPNAHSWIEAIDAYNSMNYYNIIGSADFSGNGMQNNITSVSSEIVGEYILISTLNPYRTGYNGMYPNSLATFRIQDIIDAGPNATMPIALDVATSIPPLGYEGNEYRIGLSESNGTIYSVQTTSINGSTESILTINSVEVLDGLISETEMFSGQVSGNIYYGKAVFG